MKTIPLIFLVVMLQAACQAQGERIGQFDNVVGIEGRKAPVNEADSEKRVASRNEALPRDSLRTENPKVNPHGIDQNLPMANQWVLYTIQQLPTGGGYSVSLKALNGLKQGVRMDATGKVLEVNPRVALPSFCSSATYIVLAKVTSELVKRNVEVSPAALKKMARIGLPDGVGVWGRWNANGPGTARLFAELNCGENFTSYEKALPGDFMKIWWTEEIGSKESGHSVVFLGNEKKDGVDMVRFWSSNIPDGYGEQLIKRSKVKRVLFLSCLICAVAKLTLSNLI